MILYSYWSEVYNVRTWYICRQQKTSYILLKSLYYSNICKRIIGGAMKNKHIKDRWVYLYQCVMGHSISIRSLLLGIPVKNRHNAIHFYCLQIQLCKIK